MSISQDEPDFAFQGKSHIVNLNFHLLVKQLELEFEITIKMFG